MVEGFLKQGAFMIMHKSILLLFSVIGVGSLSAANPAGKKVSFEVMPESGKTGRASVSYTLDGKKYVQREVPFNVKGLATTSEASGPLSITECYNRPENTKCCM
jgi:hypothetical protein